jgi:hypothetical protein
MRMRCYGKYAPLQIPLLTLFFSTIHVHAADAHHLRRHVAHVRHVEHRGVAACAADNDQRYFCAAPQATRLMSTRQVADVAYARISEGTIIGSRPADCPHAYCGCGLRKHLGLADARLNLAANWARLFPREASPRAGLAAVRSHHVMYIESSAGDGLWTVRDYNSGGGLSRIRTADVRGYTFVNPHAGLGARAAAASDRPVRHTRVRRQPAHNAAASGPAERPVRLAAASTHVGFTGH